MYVQLVLVLYMEYTQLMCPPPSIHVNTQMASLVGNESISGGC
jgi:hypothetical protein